MLPLVSCVALFWNIARHSLIGLICDGVSVGGMRMSGVRGGNSRLTANLFILISTNQILSRGQAYILQTNVYSTQSPKLGSQICGAFLM